MRTPLMNFLKGLFFFFFIKAKQQNTSLWSLSSCLSCLTLCWLTGQSIMEKMSWAIWASELCQILHARCCMSFFSSFNHSHKMLKSRVNRRSLTFHMKERLYFNFPLCLNGYDAVDYKDMRSSFTAHSSSIRLTLSTVKEWMPRTQAWGK